MVTLKPSSKSVENICIRKKERTKEKEEQIKKGKTEEVRRVKPVYIRYVRHYSL